MAHLLHRQAELACITLVSLGAYHDGVEKAAPTNSRDGIALDGAQRSAQSLAHSSGVIGEALVTKDLERGHRNSAP